MKKKKVKGVMVIEATLVLSVFLIEFAAFILSIRSFTLQGYLHTASAASVQTVNMAAQIINVFDVENENEKKLTNEQISTFADILSEGTEETVYGREAKALYLQICPMSADDTESLFKAVYEKKLVSLINEYVKAKIPSWMMKENDLYVSNFSITEDEKGRRLDAEISYTINYAWAYLENISKTIHITAYLE